jgi:hypothetical protein
MFEGEVQTAGIEMALHIHESFTKLNVDFVKMDPSRVLQVGHYMLVVRFSLIRSGSYQLDYQCHQVYYDRSNADYQSHHIRFSGASIGQGGTLRQLLSDEGEAGGSNGRT